LIRKTFLLLALPAFAAVATPALAADGQWSLGLSGGTLGAGPEIAYRYGEHVGVRANAGFFSYDRSEELDDIDFNGDLRLNSFGLMADWFPFGGGFRLSAGARANNNEIRLDAQPTTGVQIGNVTYSPAQVGRLTGTITTDSFAPTLTLGYGGKIADGFTLGFELGLMLQGSPAVEDLTATGLLANDPTFRANLEQERRQIEADADDFKLWPVLQLHLIYRF
jgi:hypothetical protein